MSLKPMLMACVFAPLAFGVALADDAQPATPAFSMDAAKTAPQIDAGATAADAKTADDVKTTDDREPDLSALRYYAHSHDLNRVAAEIRRIKADNPTWNPPDDLYADPKTLVDEGPLWQLYVKKDYAGVDAKIAEMKQVHPNWTPSHDFTQKYAHAKTADLIVAKYADKQWSAIVELATNQEGIVNCNEIDLSWRIAEGFARSGDEDKAADIYGFLLNSCTNQAARLGTAMKAAEVLTKPAKVEQVMALGKKRPDGTNEFAGIVEGRIRADLGDFAAAKTKTPVAPDRIEAFEKTTLASKKWEDELLLGWYYRKTKETEKALAWTKAAYEGDANVKTAEAYALALREGFHFDDAEKLSYEWRDKGEQFRQLYIDIVSTSITAHGHDADVVRRQSEQETLAQVPVEKELTGSKGTVYGRALDKPMVYCGPQRPLTPEEIARLERFKTEVETAKSALGAQAMGWRLYEANMPTDAAFWFEHSMVWAPNEPAATGLAVTARRLNRLAVYREILAKYGQTYPALLALNGRQRTCMNAGLAKATSAPTTLFSSVTALPATAPTATSSLAATQNPVMPVTDANGSLTPSDVTMTEQRAAVETIPTTAPVYHRPVHRRIARRTYATPRYEYSPSTSEPGVNGVMYGG
jgi:hypothetical protein